MDLHKATAIAPTVMQVVQRWKNVDLSGVTTDVAKQHITKNCQQLGLDQTSTQVVLDNVLPGNTRSL
jgi:hypothetical protein